jgi:hypothetical protein
MCQTIGVWHWDPTRKPEIALPSTGFTSNCFEEPATQEVPWLSPKRRMIFLRKSHCSASLCFGRAPPPPLTGSNAGTHANDGPVLGRSRPFLPRTNRCPIHMGTAGGGVRPKFSIGATTRSLERGEVGTHPCTTIAPLSDSKLETHPSVPNRQTMELWCHGRSQERVGAGAVVQIQPDNPTFHVRHVLNGTRTCVDLRFISNNQAKYAAIVLAVQVMMDYLRRQPHGTRSDAMVIRGDLELILKQLDWACKCKSQELQPCYHQALGMFRQCIDAYMTPSTIEKIRLKVHPDIQLLHIPREQSPISKGTRRRW